MTFFLYEPLIVVFFVLFSLSFRSRESPNEISLCVMQNANKDFLSLIFFKPLFLSLTNQIIYKRCKGIHSFITMF